MWEADPFCTRVGDVIHSVQWNYTVMEALATHILGVEHKEVGGDLSKKMLQAELAGKLAGVAKHPFGHRVPTILVYLHISTDKGQIYDECFLRTGRESGHGCAEGRSCPRE